MDHIEHRIHGIIEENVHIEGKVFVGNKTTIKSGSNIQGPCYIGENNLIGPNAFIRPYSFIADNCHIGMSEIKNSIIFSYSAVPHFNYIGDSIICENVNLGAGTKVANLRFDDKSVKVKTYDLSPNELFDEKASQLRTAGSPTRGQGFEDSRIQAKCRKTTKDEKGGKSWP